MTRLRTTVLAVAASLAAVALFAVATAGASGPTAHAAKGCGDLGFSNGYLNSITVSGVSCPTGKRVARAHRSCRLARGAKGRCTKRVRGFKCTESKRNYGATQFTSRATCRDGGKRVKFIISQDT